MTRTTKKTYSKEIEKAIQESHLSRDVIEAYFDCIGNPKLEYVKEAEESFYGVFESEVSFAEYYVNDLGLADCLEDWLYSCINWDDAFLEIRHDFFISKKNDKIYCFRHL